MRIPLRLPPGQTPTFKPEDIILESGDIVMIESREREVFYTGGLLGGGEYPLPRDYDLDVLGALAISGQGIASQNGTGRGGRGSFGGGSSGFGIGSIGGVPPGKLFTGSDVSPAVRLRAGTGILTVLQAEKGHLSCCNFVIQYW